MKNIHILLAHLFISFVSQAQWKNATPLGSSVNDIQFVNRYVGYAICTSTFIGNCSSTTGGLNLYRTVDGGENWILSNTGYSAAFSAIHFVDELHGWIAGTGTSYIFGTSDGGQSWTNLANTIATGVNDIYFTSTTNGFICGNSGQLRKTTNGGSSWQGVITGVTANFLKIYFYNSSLGFVTSSSGQLLRTTNGGVTWNIVNLGSNYVSDIFFISSSVGYACGSSGGMGSVLKTTDGGLTWNVMQGLTLSGYPVKRIAFTNASNGYVVTSGKGIFKTIDGGVTWTQSTTVNGFTDYFTGIHFIDNNIGFVCGNGGKIYKTTDAGNSWRNCTTGHSGAFYKVCATNKKTAYSGGYSGVIFKTDNGGLNWEMKAHLINGPSVISKILFLNDSIGFASSDTGRIYKTIDAGETWILKPTNSMRGITDLSFVNNDTGYASATGGKILRTFDGGETWDSISTSVTEDLTGIFFTNNDTGFAISYSKIHRTFDAGATWAVTNTGVINAGALKDIVFTNDSLGYCVGAFGRMLRTQDAGLNWYPTNNSTSNSEINEISAVNDSVLFFARWSSQYSTQNSGETITSETTACLQNNSNMESISMTNDGKTGYCTGGQSNSLVHIKEELELETIVSTTAYCAGSKLPIACIARGYLQTGCIINIELSDASGSFSNPTIIGSYAPTSIYVYQSGVVNATIPANTPSGLYRIRSVATAPVLIGADNGFDITISAQATPTVSLQSNINGTACTGSHFAFNANTSAGGLNPSYQWFVNGVSINNNSSVYNTDTLQNNDVVNVEMTSSLGCVSSASAISNNYTASLIPFSISVSASDTICQNSQTQLNVVGGNSFMWTPNVGLNNVTIANPLASPIITTNYSVNVTDANGCTATKNVNVVVNPTPTNFIATNDTTLCIKSTLQLFANSNFQYAWLPSSAVSNSSVSNPIANAINTNTDFIAIATSTDNCVGSDTLHVSLHPQLPSPILLTNDTILCNFQGQLQLHAQAGGVDYQWSPSVFVSSSLELNPYVNVPSSMSYYLQVTDAFGCIVKDTVNITLQSGISLPILQMVNSSVCPNSNFYLVAYDNPSYIYQWTSATAIIPYPNISTSPIDSISATATFYLTVTNINTTCSKTDSVKISLYNYQTQFPIITESNGVLNCTPAHFYQWYLDSVPISLGVQQSYTPTAEGSYYVAVYDSAVCNYYSSAPYNFLFTALSNSIQKNETIGIYPNPAGNQITIYNLQSTKYSLTIQNTLGEIVFTKNNFAASETIDVSNYESGVYFVKVNDKVVKFLKK